MGRKKFYVISWKYVFCTIALFTYNLVGFVILDQRLSQNFEDIFNCLIEPYAFLGHLGQKLKSLISGKFSHLFNRFLPSIFLFCLLFPFSWYFLSFLGDFFHLIPYLSLTMYINIINTTLSFDCLKISQDNEFVLITGRISHSIFEVFTLHHLCLWFFYCAFCLISTVEVISFLLTCPSKILKAD